MLRSSCAVDTCSKTRPAAVQTTAALPNWTTLSITGLGSTHYRYVSRTHQTAYRVGGQQYGNVPRAQSAKPGTGHEESSPQTGTMVIHTVADGMRCTPHAATGVITAVVVMRKLPLVTDRLANDIRRATTATVNSKAIGMIDLGILRSLRVPLIRSSGSSGRITATPIKQRNHDREGAKVINDQFLHHIAGAPQGSGENQNEIRLRSTQLSRARPPLQFDCWWAT